MKLYDLFCHRGQHFSKNQEKKDKAHEKLLFELYSETGHLQTQLTWLKNSESHIRGEKMDNDLIDYFTKVAKLKTSTQVWNEWAIFASEIGFDNVLYAHNKSKSDENYCLTFISTLDPNWIKYYVENNYDQKDWIAQQIAKGQPFVLYEYDKIIKAFKHNKELRDLHEQFKENGVRSSFTLRLEGFNNRNWGGIEVLSSKMNSYEIRNILAQKKELIIACALFTHQRIQELLLNEGKTLDIKFPRRQHEILKCLAEGLSNKQVGEYLKISTHTVSFHLKEIQHRLKVRTNREILPKAIQLGVIKI